MPKTVRKSPPETRKKYSRSEETRARVLEAALEECAVAGFHKASMANIAARADVAVGILNYHFGSRQEMLREMMSTYTQHFLETVSVPREGRGFFEYETVVLEAYLKFLHDNPNYVELAEEVRRHEPEMYQKGKTDQFTGLVSRIKTGISQGELPAMTTEEIRIRAHLMLGAYTFLDRVLEDDKYPGDEFVITTVMNMLRYGLSQPA
jgi:AcrR family transcriptional regulator